MTTMPRVARFACALALAFAASASATALAAQQTPATRDTPVTRLDSETPAHFTPVTGLLDYERRDVMIPMRDGVKLHTVILVPKGARGAAMLMTRTPYNATGLTSHAASAHLGPILQGYDNAVEVIEQGGYIRVVQDIRGKWGSEGDYVMNRPMIGPLNPTRVDESTDTYDTIDWLVKNVPESNGRVGILGISYDGYLALTALVHPHPALKVSVPMNPMVDGWMGDDWFHYGAFRQPNLTYIYEQEASRTNEYPWYSTSFDLYDQFMRAGSAGELGRQRGMEQVGFWRQILAHPAYDRWWQLQAMDSVLAREPLTVPTMLVHSLWDQEDIYGAPAVYRALQGRPEARQNLFMVLGPWHHGGEIGEGSTLGPLHFGTDTGLYFRLHILAPFLARYLKDGAPSEEVAPVTAFESGSNSWQRLPTWPAGCPAACVIQATPLYLLPGMTAGFQAPAAAGAAFDEYVSDPAKPVTYVRRPVRTSGALWGDWLTTDQRDPGSRSDVLTFVTPVLDAPVKIAGRPVANLVASTTGTDADWVVKLIDVYPDEVADQPEMGGFQLMVSADIFRGRYRQSFSDPKPIAPNTPLLYRFGLPNANHVFLPGHRIMVQVQSSWFPLYDRNPQTFVQNIFWAKPGDYKKAVQRVYHAPGQASFVELPLVQK
ncbi:MAG TPA: CocE/NonD family hydrolase [Longimicrobiales bacterium]